jgi:hypothetical protein
MAIKQLKDLTLSFDNGGAAPIEIQCQLSRAALVDNPEIETLTSFCGIEDFPTPKYTLELAGWQDYGTVDSVFDMLHTSYLSYQDDTAADTPIDFVLSVGTKTRSGQAKPTNDPEFGGDAGAALTSTVNLSVVSDVTDGTVAP